MFATIAAASTGHAVIRAVTADLLAHTKAIATLA
jgi:hypothetical protein